MVSGGWCGAIEVFSRGLNWWNGMLSDVRGEGRDGGEVSESRRCTWASMTCAWPQKDDGGD